MVNLAEYIFKKIPPIIQGWDEDSIYAISFFVHTNEATDNIPYFAISYNTEKDCGHCSEISEERWNYAFWRQDECEIIGDEESTNLLMKWFEENNIINIGQEDETQMYDENGNYIGKGPTGIYELIQVISDVAKRLHDEKIILNTFGKEIPIVIHDLEYAWYELEATQRANPNGITDMFLNSFT